MHYSYLPSVIFSRKVQFILWLFAFVVLLFFNALREPWTEAYIYALLSLSSYAAIIYPNALFLIPRFFAQKKYFTYCIAAIILVTFVTLIRSATGIFIFNYFFAAIKNKITIENLTFHGLSSIYVLLFSFFFRLAMDYYLHQERERKIETERTKAELKYLKQQINPHFLFNTLNNIYYVVRKESPAGAELIERLSTMMRYFMNDQQDEFIPLTEEIKLLQGYITLETMRLHFEMPVKLQVTGHTKGIQIPPFLILPLVENIFKHGVDQTGTHYKASIDITITADALVIKTFNDVAENTDTKTSSGTGLKNLIKRLSLYYGDKFSILQQLHPSKQYEVLLKIPLT